MTGTILLILALFVVGLVLIGLEALVIPGFGVPGVVGGLIVIYAAVRGWSDLGPAWGMTLIFAGTALSIAMFFWLARSGVGRRMTLRAELTPLATYDADARRAGVAVGQRGVAASPLRPSGFAWFGEERVEVRTGGEWLDVNTKVAVVAIRDGKVVVEAAPTDAPVGLAEGEAPRGGADG